MILGKRTDKHAKTMGFGDCVISSVQPLVSAWFCHSFIRIMALSLSLTHTHTHTFIRIMAPFFLSLSLSFSLPINF